MSNTNEIPKTAKSLHREALERLDQLTRAKMATDGIPSYSAALAIVRKERPDLVKIAYGHLWDYPNPNGW